MSSRDSFLSISPTLSLEMSWNLIFPRLVVFILRMNFYSLKTVWHSSEGIWIIKCDVCGTQMSARDKSLESEFTSRRSFLLISTFICIYFYELWYTFELNNLCCCRSARGRLLLEALIHFEVFLLFLCLKVDDFSMHFFNNIQHSSGKRESASKLWHWEIIGRYINQTHTYSRL